MREIAKRPDEVRGLSDLLFGELARAIGGIAAIHRGIAQRAFGGTGPGGRPAQLAHDAISTGVYALLRSGAGLVGRGAGAALELRAPGDGRELSTSPRGSAVIAAINGLVGDVLEREDSDLQEPMSVRVKGRPVTPEPVALTKAFPRATPRLVVFVHGLMETEHAWRLGTDETGETYASRLSRDLGCTPVHVRYNSGRHISENGRSLSELLGALVESWPVEVEQIHLIGHSMGGLVSRSACHYGSAEDVEWVSGVRHVVSLGSPHMGAPLEQIVHLASAGLDALPEVRPFGSFLRRRSAGIRDLRHGSLVDEDWRDRDRDALRAAAITEVPLLDGAMHCFVAATVTSSPKHPLGRLVGDVLVLEPSASGRARDRRIPFRAEHGMHVGGTHHLALLNHPEVYGQLRDWLATEPAAAGV
ncbi:MAG TPA: alpha/beta fold hydrolase [Thermoleophilaceae bacterium]|nr:alpha/beta fold hydrolase [Thermoleophilaceae bacterium]